VLATSSAVALSIALAGTTAPALAQDEAAAPAERITVTGSRIVRRDFEANSPIVTVESEDFEAQTSLNIEAYLNQLPQFNPASTPVTTEFDVQITPVNSVGIATVSLRGLGSNRNLVLVDGHRQVPVNLLMVTDVNAIPTALIERSEIITGGASAVYGADAVSGVLNVILKKDFEGLELDAQYGMNEVGDGEEFRMFAVAGANLEDGRGNVTLGLEHYSRSASWERNRDWQVEEWGNPLLASGDFFVAGVHAYAVGSTPAPSAAFANAIFADAPDGTGACIFGSCGNPFPATFSFNPDGSLWVNGGIFGPGVISQFQIPIDGQEYALQTNLNVLNHQTTTSIKWNDVNAFTAAPQTRYSFFAAGNYDITDSIQWFGRVNFSESDTKTNLFPSPAIAGWEALIPYNPAVDSPVRPDLTVAEVQAAIADPTNPLYANPTFIPTNTAGAEHPVPVELAILLNSRSVQNAPWQPNFIPFEWFADRSTINTITNFQLETGFRGELPISDWTWETYVSHGEANTYNIANGNMSLQRFRQVMTAPDYGRNANIEPNQESVNPGFGNDPLQCTSGFYDTLFAGDVPPSSDCIAAVAATLQTRTQIQQDVAEATFEGGLLELPAGELRLAGGVQYRQVDGQFYPDILQSTSSSNDQVIGVYPAGYMDASTSASEGFAEAIVPVLSDLPFIQRFELELAARYSSYYGSSALPTDEGYGASPDDVEAYPAFETDGWTYKALGNWDVNDWLRFRGGYNRASRAPNLGELFLSRQMIFTVGAALFGDPCGVRSNSPFGAGGTGPDPVLTPGESSPEGIFAPGQTPEGAASTRLICEAQMGATSANVFYNVSNAPGATAGLFSWIYQQGNAELEPETADTWTLGLVAESPFDNPWLSGFRASLDYYQIEISDAILQYSIDYGRYLCYGAVQVSTPAEAEARANSPECQNLPRIGGTTVGFAGGASDILIEYDNQATISTSGYDIAVNWTSQFEDLGIGLPGGLGLSGQLTVLDHYRTQQSSLNFDVPIEWKGTTGPQLTGLNGGAYDYRFFGSVSYFYNQLAASLRWRHLPEVYAPGYATQKAIFRNNLEVLEAAQANGLIVETPVSYSLDDDNNPATPPITVQHTNFSVGPDPNGVLPGIILGFSPGSFLQTEAYDVFDVSGSWQLNDAVALRFGVNNLLDTDPPPANRTAGFAPGVNPTDSRELLASVCDAFGGHNRVPGSGGTTNGLLGCAPPGAALPNPGTATAGFYDVNGRSFFVGLKMNY
jgi:outer membrane receptor protein involved in Fe transport